jgi:Flp pilus assembly protein TadG
MRTRRGGAALEFGLIAPLLVVLALGTAEWGWFLHRKVTLTYGLRGAVFQGALTRVEDDPLTMVEDSFEAFLIAEGFDVDHSEIEVEAVNTAFGRSLRATATVPYTRTFTVMPTPALMVVQHATLLEDR